MISAPDRHPRLSNAVRLAAVLVLLLLLSACSSVTVSRDYDQEFDFSTLKTYAWFPDIKEKSSLGAAELARVQSAIDSGLRARGYQPVDRDPDFLISADAVSEQRTQVISHRYSYRYWGADDTYRFNVGTLIVDFVGSATNQLIWRGQAEAVLTQDPSSDELNKRIDEAVAKMLAEFPPKQASSRSGYR